MRKTTIELNFDTVNSVDMMNLYQYADWTSLSDFFKMDAGVEHYKLLAYLAKTLKCTKFVDIGTYVGLSALALSTDASKTVVTIDIRDYLPGTGDSIRTKNNIKCMISSNYLNNLKDIIANCEFILIDIDHNGINEQNILNKLREIKYKGIVMLDDINLNQAMKTFFDNIPEKKIEITKYGHWSGTGLVIFDTKRYDIVLT